VINMLSSETFPAVLAGALITFGLWTQRVRRFDSSGRRRRQLQRAELLYRTHSGAVESILESESVPDVLKRMIINFSDAIANEDVVEAIAKMFISGAGLDPNQEDGDVREAIHKLARQDPEMAYVLCQAIITGMHAAMLRFDATAILYEEVSAKMAASLAPDVGFVVTASRMRKSELPFLVRSPAAALA